MTRPRHRIRIAALAALPVLLLASAAPAQDRSSGGFLDNLFNRGEPSGPPGESRVDVQRGQAAQADPGDLTVRLDRMENALRQLTGTIEQLQFRNQQIEMQLKRMQDDTEYRFQQLGSKGGPPAGAQPRAMSPQTPGNAPPAPTRRPPAPHPTARDPAQRPDHRPAGRHARQPLRRVQSRAASECARRAAR